MEFTIKQNDSLIDMEKQMQDTSAYSPSKQSLTAQDRRKQYSFRKGPTSMDLLKQAKCDSMKPMQKGKRLLSRCGAMFLVMALLQAIVVTAIQTVIAVLGDFRGGQLEQYVPCVLKSFNASNRTLLSNSTFPSFGRDKEIYVVIFIFLVVYNLCLCLYALLAQRIVEVWSFVFINFLLVIYASVQVYQFRGFGEFCDQITLIGWLAMGNGGLPPNSLPSELLPVYGGLLNLYSFLLSTCLRHRTIFSPYTDRGDAPIPKFKKFADSIRKVSTEFATLFKSLFDADPFTLQYIKLLQQSCNLMSNIIEAFTSPEKPLLSPPVGSSGDDGPALPTSLETSDNFDTNHTLGIVCNKLLSDSQSSAQKLQSQPFSYEHLAVIEDSLLTLIEVPFLLPPLYFASHQSTSVQLALSPSISSDKPVTVVLGTHLALKVEGVVKHSGERIYRSPESVVVSVKPKVEKLSDSLSKFPTLHDLEETPVVKNDYYIAEFLLTLPAAGQYVLKIDNNLVDHEGKIWHTGPSVEMNVVVDVEEKLRDQQQTRSSTAAAAAGSTSTPSTSNGESSKSTQQKSSSQW